MLKITTWRNAVADTLHTLGAVLVVIVWGALVALISAGLWSWILN